MRSPVKQDDFLDEGFFRSGQSVRRTRYLFTDGNMWSTIWSRINLQTYALTKSQRKLYRRLLRQYSVSVEVYRDRDDQREVYDAYQSAHQLDVGESVDVVLGNDLPLRDWRTHALRVSDADGRLVAFSCFDLGSVTIASLFGCYRPELARESLGFFTMLAELNYGRQRGLEYYHPGYCVPGLAAFDYKLRLPNLEGRNYLSPTWKSMAACLLDPLPHLVIDDKLTELSGDLIDLDIPHFECYAPLVEVLPMEELPYGPLPLPKMISLDVPEALGEAYAGFNPAKDQYEVWYGSMVADLIYEPDFMELADQLPPSSNIRLYETRVLLFTADSACAKQLSRYLSQEALTSQIIRFLRQLRGDDEDGISDAEADDSL